MTRTSIPNNVTRRSLEKIEDALFLISQGVRPADAARRVGWAPNTLARMIQRAEEDGHTIVPPEYEEAVS